jgi:hypothetical protein
LVAAAMLLVGASSIAGVKVSAVRSGADVAVTRYSWVPLNDVGATSITFGNSTPGKRYVLTYSAECTAASDVEGYDLDAEVVVWVNDREVARHRLCHSIDMVEKVPFRASFSTVITAAEGQNRIRLRAEGNAFRITLGNSSLVVYD